MMEFGQSQEQRVSSIPGLISWGWAETGDNEFTLTVVYKNRKAAETAAPIAAGIFGEMASMVAAPPERVLLDGEWFMP